MLTGITLENFKAFKEPQFIPIKPITLVFGPNSSGKSSIIHALAFLKHVHETNGNCNPGTVSFGWSRLELGSWQNLVFGHNKEASMMIMLHTKTSSIQWRFENTSTGPRVVTFQIEEGGVATARGSNVGNDSIRWAVELHASHWLWNEFKAALWKKITGLTLQRIRTFDEQAEQINRENENRELYGPKDEPVASCGQYSQDIFEEHFKEWLGDKWRVPPIGCNPFPNEHGRAFEGLFPRRAFSSWSDAEPQAWTELRRDSANFSFDSDDDIPF